jgi:hypothetical protein
VIDASELQEWAGRFGVSTVQIRRDHFISHVLRAVGELQPDTRFFGGTALCRTYLDQTRLSEDIDLLHAEPREFLTTLRHEVPKAVRREFPGTVWSELSSEGDGLATLLALPDLDAIKIYVGRDGPNTAAWEFAPAPVRLRYKDLPSEQVFQCPTAPTFAAMKLAAWSDRYAPRDLFDLAGLATLGTLCDPNVARIFEAKMGVPIIMADFARVPRVTATAWETELAAQVGVLPPADECLELVRVALAAAV